MKGEVDSQEQIKQIVARQKTEALLTKVTDSGDYLVFVASQCAEVLANPNASDEARNRASVIINKLTSYTVRITSFVSEVERSP